MSKNSLTYLLPLVISLTRYFFFAGFPFLIFYCLFSDRFHQNKLQSNQAQFKDFLREVLHSLQTSCILVAVGFLVLETPLVHYTQFYMDATTYPKWWILVSVLLSLLVHDTNKNPPLRVGCCIHIELGVMDQRCF